MLAESPSLRYCLPLWREFREWLQFFLQGYLVIHFAVMKIALVDMKIGKVLSHPQGGGMWASVF